MIHQMKHKPQKPLDVQLTKGPLETYGIDFKGQNPRNQLNIELAFMRCKTGSTRGWNGEPNPKGKPAWLHFVNAVNLIWNYPGTKKPFVWHPWAIDMAKASFAHKRLGVAGCGSSGKSDYFAVYALVSWLSNPFKNVVLVTTTTLKDAKGRIWGKITGYYNNMVAPPPGKLLDSSYELIAVDPTSGKSMPEYGISLFPGESSKSAESSRAIRGKKHGDGGKIIVIMDEMAELSNSIVNTFEENLTQNPNHQIIGIANPNTPYDPFGLFCEPIAEGGYASITESDFEWEGKGGHVIRFDAELSPNVIEGRTIYPFLMTREQLEEKRHQREIGRLSARGYYRGVKGFWLLDADDEAIYSPAELFRCHGKPVWQGIPTKVGGFDVGYTAGGDRSVLITASIGVCTDGKKRIAFDDVVYLNEDLKNKEIDRTRQIVAKLKAECEKRGILPENLAIDSTAGGGKTFCDAVWANWSNKILRVDFGGKASDRPVSSADRAKSSVRYVNRVSELWYAGKEAVRCDQLRAIPKEASEEMVVRRFKDNKAQDGGSRIKVESKLDMKQRTGKSPDIADALFLVLDLCRERHGLSQIEKAGNQRENTISPLKKKFNKLADLWAA